MEKNYIFFMYTITWECLELLGNTANIEGLFSWCFKLKSLKV